MFNLMLARPMRLGLSKREANHNQRVNGCGKTRCIARFPCGSTAPVLNSHQNVRLVCHSPIERQASDRRDIIVNTVSFIWRIVAYRFLLRRAACATAK